MNRSSNFLKSDMLTFDDVNEKIWSVGEIFIPNSSRLLSQNQLDKMIEGGLKLFHLNNVPFTIRRYFGPISKSR